MRIIAFIAAVMAVITLVALVVNVRHRNRGLALFGVVLLGAWLALAGWGLTT